MPKVIPATVLGLLTASIVDMAENCDCDLLIVGARGLGGLRGAFLGSVSQAVVQRASVPVTVVKHTQPSKGATARIEHDGRVPSQYAGMHACACRPTTPG